MEASTHIEGLIIIEETKLTALCGGRSLIRSLLNKASDRRSLEPFRLKQATIDLRWLGAMDRLGDGPWRGEQDQQDGVHSASYLLKSPIPALLQQVEVL